MASRVKDPQDMVSYGFDWDAYAESLSANIVSSSWVLSSEEITNEGSTLVGNKTMVTIAGGIDQKDYLITNQITLDDGRKESRSIKILVRNI